MPFVAMFLLGQKHTADCYIIIIIPVNDLSEKVLGKKVMPNVQDVGIYTGEQIGVEYLFNQTGEVLQHNSLEDEYTSRVC